jgi:dTDP-4-amino-4,6-dideoxygalactose transaminase
VVPSFTFAAGPLAIRRRGLQPRFIDIDPVTWQPSLADAEVALAADNGVGGILLSNSFGVANAEIGAWEDLAHRHGIPLILDSAAGLGSTYPWHEPLGGRGSCEVFSFHATKTLAVGEGGALASRDLDVIAAVDRLKNFGFDGSHQAITAGTNGKLTELAAAIGLRQMEALPDRLRRRRAVFDAYISRLQPLGLEFQPGAERSALAFVSALLPSRAQRDALVAALDGVGVECRMYYKPPVHRHPVFAGLEGIRPLVGTEDLCSRIISLPMADGLDADAVARIGSTAEAILRG